MSAQPKDWRACAALRLSWRPFFGGFYIKIRPLLLPELISRKNLCGLEPQLIKLEFIIYLPKLKVSGCICRKKPGNAPETLCLGLTPCGGFLWSRCFPVIWAAFRQSLPAIGQHFRRARPAPRSLRSLRGSPLPASSLPACSCFGRFAPASMPAETCLAIVGRRPPYAQTSLPRFARQSCLRIWRPPADNCGKLALAGLRPAPFTPEKPPYEGKAFGFSPHLGAFPAISPFLAAFCYPAAFRP